MNVELIMLVDVVTVCKRLVDPLEIVESNVMCANIAITIYGMNSATAVAIGIGVAGDVKSLAQFGSSLTIEGGHVVAEPEDVGCGGDKMRYELRGFDSVAYVCSR